LRAQGEYAAVAAEMEKCVLAVHPWAKQFLQPERKETPYIDKLFQRLIGSGTPHENEIVNGALKEIEHLKETWG
jgi:hypothetical protein